ncbi:MAG TPA: malonyl-CoA decarboxylase, partial [Thermoanaerobaculia bacterium]
MANRLMGFLGRLGKRRTSRSDLFSLASALLTGRGEASGMAMARHLLERYRGLSPEQRLDFLLMLAERFGPDHARLERAIAAYQSGPDPRAALALHNAAEPRRQELFRRLNRAPGGTEKLVRMREDVIRELPKNPSLSAVDIDFVHLFSSWFNPRFLVLKRIDWSTPADLLEKIIRYEAVHEIKSWADLRRRLEPGDRRCFAFFHPTLADEPLVFVEVALISEAPSSIAPLLAEARPGRIARATTAVFYSISSCQPGLRGVSIGNFLVKHVVEELLGELPNLKTFVTLSPVPRFAGWLSRERESKSLHVFGAAERSALRALDQPGWPGHPQTSRALQPVLTHAIAQYLLVARDPSGKPVDPVAKFHLGNGARLERVNWMGDPSPKGLAEGAGFMVNYLYDLSRIERNHELFANKGEVVASPAVKRLLGPAREAGP